jgi:ubiquinone/menaquinone biosynthesis C-methylase UbiE
MKRELMMNHQSESFLNGEGDAWYERNRSTINDTVAVPPDVKFILQTLKDSTFLIQDLLEIGCASADKLNILSSSFLASGTGIDPSSMAITQAKKQYPDLDLQVGLASKLPFNDHAFDLIFFGFCLYLVPNDEIQLAISESLRVLRPKGFIAITDFDSGIEKSVPYKHRNGIFSYKRNYLEMFRSFSNMTLIAKYSFSHSGEFFVTERDERVAVQIFYVE